MTARRWKEASYTSLSAVFKRRVKRVIGWSSFLPVLGDNRSGGPQEATHVLLMVCGPGFNVTIPSAARMIALGYCRGFAEVGVGYRLSSVFNLDEELDAVERPIVFLSAYHYEYLSARTRRRLREVPHIVWVTPWFPQLEKVYSENDLPDPRQARFVAKRVLESGAGFLWANVPPSCLSFYSLWEQGGQRLESLPLACDTSSYYPEPANMKYAEVQLAFVGGYRPYKNVQYLKYLKPYEAELTVFGYDEWPYSGFRGLIAPEDEHLLYQNSKVCPCLDEPHAEIVGDIVERVFKVLGSRGLAVTNVVPFYREYFADNELLVPSSIDDYYEMVDHMLRDPDLNARYREQGYAAVRNRHTYSHRASRVLQMLGLAETRAVRPPS